MKLEKALKILFDYVGTGPEAEPVDFDKACRIGAEAILREVIWRQNDPGGAIHRLPSETEE